MDGNSATKAPVLDNLVGTSKTPIGNKPTLASTPQAQTLTQAKPVVTSMNGKEPPLVPLKPFRMRLFKLKNRLKIVVLINHNLKSS